MASGVQHESLFLAMCNDPAGVIKYMYIERKPCAVKQGGTDKANIKPVFERLRSLIVI